ncbi:hypothetical protein VQ056_10400 [Paenibacillus sp. JTLBN-2024]
MKRAISLFNLVFMIPAIVLSFMVWNDYSSRIEDSAKQLAASDRSLFFLDGGNKVMSVEEDDDTGLRGELYDVKTQQLLKKVPLRSNLHGQLVSTYQNGRLILVTLDDSDQLNIHAIDSEGGVKELAQKTVELSGFLDSSVHPWRGKLIVSGETNGSVPFIAQVEKGKLQKVNLDQPKLLPSRPTFIREVTGSFESNAAVPMFEVDLHDDRNAFVSGWLNPQNTPSRTFRRIMKLHSMRKTMPPANLRHNWAEQKPVCFRWILHIRNKSGIMMRRRKKREAYCRRRCRCTRRNCIH